MDTLKLFSILDTFDGCSHEYVIVFVLNVVILSTMKICTSLICITTDCTHLRCVKIQIGCMTKEACPPIYLFQR